MNNVEVEFFSPKALYAYLVIPDLGPLMLVEHNQTDRWLVKSLKELSIKKRFQWRTYERISFLLELPSRKLTGESPNCKMSLKKSNRSPGLIKRSSYRENECIRSNFKRLYSSIVLSISRFKVSTASRRAFCESGNDDTAGRSRILSEKHLLETVIQFIHILYLIWTLNI